MRVADAVWCAGDVEGLGRMAADPKYSRDEKKKKKKTFSLFDRMCFVVALQTKQKIEFQKKNYSL